MKKNAKEESKTPRSLAEIASDPGEDSTEKWDLRLYVAGQTPRSVAAFANLKRLCEEHLAGRYNIEVIDLVKHPQLAAGDQIIAIPTLVRKSAAADPQNRRRFARHRTGPGRIAIASREKLVVIFRFPIRGIPW